MGAAYALAFFAAMILVVCMIISLIVGITLLIIGIVKRTKYRKQLLIQYGETE